jgi:NAD(P)-dependent dehydrogenase (short-subunit alcohol dehydrogenase family)
MNNQTNKFPSDLLLDKVVVITGGGTGLGKAMAKKFLELGARVVISGRKKEVLNAAVEEFASYKNDIHSVASDVRDAGCVEELLADSIDRFGKVDALVNNAAVNLVSPTEKLSHAAFRLVVDTVLIGTINCTLAFGKQWIQKKQPGNVLNIVTGYASNGSGFVVPSAASKAGVQVLTKSLAVEWAKYNIRFNGIAPGPFPTEGAFGRLMPLKEMQELAISHIPMRRFGNPEELANLASFLLSDISSYITGEIIHIDGGLRLNLAGEMNVLEHYFMRDDWRAR